MKGNICVVILRASYVRYHKYLAIPHVEKISRRVIQALTYWHHYPDSKYAVGLDNSH
jgi:hypothetical protein